MKEKRTYIVKSVQNHPRTHQKVFNLNQLYSKTMQLEEIIAIVEKENIHQDREL